MVLGPLPPVLEPEDKSKFAGALVLALCRSEAELL